MFRMIGLAPFATPIDLGQYGAPGCFSEVDAFGSTFVLADANGNDFWTMTSPFRLMFIGLPFEMELVVLDPPANALGVVTSNRVSGVFGISH